MIQAAELTVLVDNNVADRRLVAEHGLSIWIEVEGQRILFDTGQGPALGSNARALDVDLRRADAVVLSHGHYDHAGGLAACDCLTQAQLFVHPAAFSCKYAGDGVDQLRVVGSGLASVERLQSSVLGVTLTPKPTQLGPGVWVTGEIPRRTEFEDTGGSFFLDLALTVPDPLADDQAVYLETHAGIVVLLGCAHAGLVNTLDYVAELTGERRIYGVFGGLHLRSASSERIQRTIAALQRYQVQRIGPAHCTGRTATEQIRSACPDQFAKVQAGTRLTA